MLNKILLDTHSMATHNLPEPLLNRAYFFHDIRITCYTNHPAILTILDGMLRMFPERSEPRGETTYYIFCYENASQFPEQLPQNPIHIETIRLLTRTKLTFYRSPDYTTEYQSYAALAGSNAPALSIINSTQNVALTQLEKPEYYQTKFLRRYILLMALGQLMRSHGFEPCHAAAITAPGNNDQGALIIGGSGQGKTTLSLGCVSIGCGLLGDDLVMLREDGMDRSISAYTIMHEVSVRSGTIDLWQMLSFLRAFPADFHDKRYCTIEQVRRGAARIQTSIRLLLFPSLSLETETRVTPLSKASTLQELVTKCMVRRNTNPQMQERLFLLLSRLAEQASGYQITIARGANDGPQIVHSLLEAVLYG